jgi:diguanylate cyclase (GGDEF)-like protein
MTDGGAPRFRLISARVLSTFLLTVWFAGIALGLQYLEKQADDALENRFQMRAEIAARFLHAYINDLMQRERHVAEAELGGPTVAAADFSRVVRAFGFEAAVLVNSSGCLMSVTPPRPEILGTRIVDRYSHLRRALREPSGAAVSSVVLSAAVKVPIVGFATRYNAKSENRVFSGAYDVTKTPLHDYMVNLSPIQGASADLIDDNGAVVASSRTLSAQLHELARLDPFLVSAMRKSSTGVYRVGNGERLFVVRNIEDAPWRLVAAVDQRALLAPLRRSGRWFHWVLYAAFCTVAYTAAELLLRLIESREKLRAMNDDLARLARVDRLTGLPNRLHLEEQLTRLISAARRQEQPLSVMIVDVDHFKSVNDSWGHIAGDAVLQALSKRMASAIRLEDMLGRWGGEEFLALLPNTDVAGASIVAERVRAAARAVPITMGDGSFRVTVSIGCATASGVIDEELLTRADKAVYSAKNLGRDRVVTSDPHP